MSSEQSGKGIRFVTSFDAECEVLRSIRHGNLIKIISSCASVDFKALVMEFMPDGNLEALLYSNSYCLDMLQRVWITGNSVLWKHVDGNIYEEEAHRRNVLERLGIRLIAEW
ncbi:hypothetical protein GH714_002998 [Hevea brasiliensis]|uniref:Serine-threonine/tyrosine-protein kinase catalytic domain-containing protein n=1 Tax=Hevea brasiliensis TaxID=3981 RepID=A0A6A6N0M3_HEVBR|nr:hypothetical protein GH714_002998 [Hevea brasiliensis]